MRFARGISMLTPPTTELGGSSNHGYIAQGLLLGGCVLYDWVIFPI